MEDHRGTEIVTDTRRGRALARLIPVGAEGWVPEHFYAEVLAERLDADFLADDHKLVEGPTFPRTVHVFRIPKTWQARQKPG